MTEHEYAEEFVILTDEDGNEYEFEIVDVIEVDGQRYAILCPADEDVMDEGYVVMRFALAEEDEEILIDIEDDAEWEKVVNFWEELLDEEMLFEEDEDPEDGR